MTRKKDKSRGFFMPAFRFAADANFRYNPLPLKSLLYLCEEVGSIALYGRSAAALA